MSVEFDMLSTPWGSIRNRKEPRSSDQTTAGRSHWGEAGHHCYICVAAARSRSVIRFTFVPAAIRPDPKGRCACD